LSCKVGLKKIRPRAEMTFNYIRNQIMQYSKDALIDRCYLEIDGNEDKPTPTWQIFTMLKWTFLYGGNKQPSKPLTEKRFAKIYRATYSLDEEYVRSFIRPGDFKLYFQILFSQQFYLQRKVMKETFAVQLKLYTQLSHKFDIGKLFLEKTGLSIEDMLFFLQTIWVIMNANKLSGSIYYLGFLENDHIKHLVHFRGEEKVAKFLKLLMVDPDNAEEKIKNAPYSLNKDELQSFERTFFTIYPLQIYKKSRIKIVHPAVMAHTMNHYIYDFLKRESNFPEEFGYRLEKYIALGLTEIKANFIPEVELKKRLRAHSKLVDFILEDDKILIECKAIELSPSTSVIPTVGFLYSGLKDSVIKAYVKQMLTVAPQLENATNEEFFGIILTYKEMYWSKFVDLYDVVKDQINDEHDIKILPPSNVFIIDLLTWDKIVQIVKDGKASLREILQKAKVNNSDPITSKLLFNMHLDEYKLKQFHLSYLEPELKVMDGYYKI